MVGLSSLLGLVYCSRCWDSSHSLLTMFTVIEPRLLHCATTQIIDSNGKCAMLMVISPKHGAIDYDWKFKGDLDDCFPSNTGIIYVRNPGIYECAVGEESIEFEVLGND